MSTKRDKVFSKADEKILREFADNLPMVMASTHEVHRLTGAQLQEMGYVEQEGKPLIPEKVYLFNYPVQIAANHYRRLKKAWLKNGQKGVTVYLKKVNGAMEMADQTTN